MSWNAALSAINTACRDSFGDTAVHTPAGGTSTTFEADSDGSVTTGNVAFSAAGSWAAWLAAFQVEYPGLDEYTDGQAMTLTLGDADPVRFEFDDDGSVSSGVLVTIGATPGDTAAALLAAVAIAFPGVNEFVDGDLVTFSTAGGGAPQSIVGVYSESFIALDSDGNKFSVEARNLWVRKADLLVVPAQHDGIAITEGIGEGTYEISDVHTDGGGGLRLILCEVAA